MEEFVCLLGKHLKMEQGNFFKDILQYLWLFFTLNVLLLLVGGAFSWATSNALKTQGIPYLSFNNLNLLLEKPLALVLLILLLLLF